MVETIEQTPMARLWSAETRDVKWWAVYTAFFRALYDAGRLSGENLAYLDGIQPRRRNGETFKPGFMQDVQALLKDHEHLLPIVTGAFTRSERVLEVVNLMLLWEAIRLLESDLQSAIDVCPLPTQGVIARTREALRIVAQDPLLASFDETVDDTGPWESALKYLGLAPVDAPMRALQELRRLVVSQTFSTLAMVLGHERPDSLQVPMSAVRNLRLASTASDPHHAEGDYVFLLRLMPIASEVLRGIKQT